MRLIEEIEAAVVEIAGSTVTFQSIHASALVSNPYWPRIKAALLAGEEMVRLLDAPPTALSRVHLESASWCFRAATGEGA